MLFQQSPAQLSAQWAVPAPAICRDTTALAQGRWIPPHIEILVDLTNIRQTIQLCEETSKIAENIAIHLERMADSTEQMRKTEMAHEQVQIDAILNHNSNVSLNEKKKRYEATATTCKNMGYGPTAEEAMKMLEKIVSNKVRKRDELENLEEHEAYNQKLPNSSQSSTITNVFTVHGVVNTGTMQHVSISVHQSISNLQHTQKELASNLDKLVTAIEQDKDLPEPTKLAVLDRAEIITLEASKPVEKRMIHRVTDSMKGLGDTLKGISALKTVWDVVEPVIKGHFGL